jgi:hypothetical protein
MMSSLASRAQVETDAFDLVEQIDQLQKSLPAFLEEYRAALIAYRDGRHQTLVAEAKRESVKAGIDIAKQRIMALQSMLRALPR